jgi:hypothetical protein
VVALPRLATLDVGPLREHSSVMATVHEVIALAAQLSFCALALMGPGCGGRTAGIGGNASSSGASDSGTDGASSGGGSGGSSGGISGGSSGGTGSSSGGTSCAPLPGCSSDSECPAPGGCGECYCESGQWECTGEI